MDIPRHTKEDQKEANRVKSICDIFPKLRYETMLEVQAKIAKMVKTRHTFLGKGEYHD